VNKLSVCPVISNHLMVMGFTAMVRETDDFVLLPTPESTAELRSALSKAQPTCILIDYENGPCSSTDLVALMREFADVRFVGITSQLDITVVRQLIQRGLSGHLLMDCDAMEIIDCIRQTSVGKKFYCGKVLDRLNKSGGYSTEHGCEAVSISEREAEILQLVAQGLTTKQIAEQLHLSFHTVMTHRKNMMAKLGLNNTAGLITYAVRENLISPNKFLFSTASEQ
jgi:DNA-binding NarL/FixJ family response regulator